MTSNHEFKDSGSGEDEVFCFYLVMGAGRELQKIKSMRHVSSKHLRKPQSFLGTGKRPSRSSHVT